MTRKKAADQKRGLAAGVRKLAEAMDKHLQKETASSLKQFKKSRDLGSKLALNQFTGKKELLDKELSRNLQSRLDLFPRGPDPLPEWLPLPDWFPQDRGFLFPPPPCRRVLCGPPYPPDFSAPLVSRQVRFPRPAPTPLASHSDVSPERGEIQLYGATFVGDPTVTTDPTGDSERQETARLGVACEPWNVLWPPYTTVDIEANVAVTGFSNISPITSGLTGSAYTFLIIGLHAISSINEGVIASDTQTINFRIENHPWSESWPSTNLGRQDIGGITRLKISLPAAQINELLYVAVEARLGVGVWGNSNLVAIVNTGIWHTIKVRYIYIKYCI